MGHVLTRRFGFSTNHLFFQFLCIPPHFTRKPDLRAWWLLTVILLLLAVPPRAPVSVFITASRLLISNFFLSNSSFLFFSASETTSLDPAAGSFSSPEVTGGLSLSTSSFFSFGADELKNSVCLFVLNSDGLCAVVVVCSKLPWAFASLMATWRASIHSCIASAVLAYMQ